MGANQSSKSQLTQRREPSKTINVLNNTTVAMPNCHINWQKQKQPQTTTPTAKATLKQNKSYPYHNSNQAGVQMVGYQQQYHYLYPNPIDFHQATYEAQQQSRSLAKSYSHLNATSLSKRRARNPLASLFQNGHSNTIGNKSAQENQRSPCSGSLKRIRPAPLSAQQATYEAMRTIDMYLIRQIARSCMDFEMEQKIDLEIRLRELAAQSMLEARNEIDVLEVEKSLLTSDQRMNCYAVKLEEQRKQLSNHSLSTDGGRGFKGLNRRDIIGSAGRTVSPSFSSLSNSQSPSKSSPVSGESVSSPSFNSSDHSRTGLRHSSKTISAKQRARNKKHQQLMQNITNLSNINCNMAVNNRASVSLSEIRIPLMWRDVDHFKGRGDYKRFAIFCLLKIDSQIYDTQLISDVDRQVTDVTFDDLVVFNEIDHDFELSLEVYSCVYLEEFTFSSTPRKLKERLTSSVSRAMGRRLASQTASTNYTRELEAYDKSYRFAMIASATLRLEDASNSVKTYDLALVSPSAHHRQYTGSSIYNRHSVTYNTSTSNSRDSDKNTLPLFGHFCCKLLVRPDVYDKYIKTGYLRVAQINVSTVETSAREDSLTSNNINSLESAKLRSALVASSKMGTLSKSSSSVYWGLLRNFTLHLRPVDDHDLEAALARGDLGQLDIKHRLPLDLRIDKYTRLLRVSNTSLTLETNQGCFVLGAYCASNAADELGHWLRLIEQQIYDNHIWGSVLNHYPVAVAGRQANGISATLC